MKSITPKTLKGFRDFLPEQARKRQYVITTLKQVFELYGFEPLETPTLEYEEILTGKYGDEGDQLMYRFEDNGKRKVAMRYDQTVPLARVIAQYQNQLTFPFKRYQIQPVWRAENTQKGRYREFFQCDIDTVGAESAVADAEIIATAVKAYKSLGFTNIKILINDRSLFNNLTTETIITLDKLKKIGRENVCEELVMKKIALTTEEANEILENLLSQQPTKKLQEIFNFLEQFGIEKETIQFTPTLARGLNYYTGMIFEIETPEYPQGSLCGGGRYDELIGMFSGTKIPAVGLAIGFDRTLEAMEELNLFPEKIALSTAQVLLTIFSEECKQQSLELTKQLQKNNIKTEIYLGEIKEKNSLEKQLKYANTKNIPFVLILGPQEISKKMIRLKKMQERTEALLSYEKLLAFLVGSTI
jgi:histidyl-tRNA synthetase